MVATRALTALALMWHIAATAAVAPRLAVQLSADEIALGEGLPVTVVATGITDNLGTLSLQPWQSHAGYEIREFRSRSIDGATEQVLELLVYPRHEGAVTLPALRMGNVHSEPVQVQIRPADIAGQLLSTVFSTESGPLWQRQQRVVSFTVKTPQPFALLYADPPNIPGFTVYPIAPKRERSDDGTTTRLSIGWLLYPLWSGKQTIVLPPVRYRLSGTDQRSFHLPELDLDVRALPPWLPPTVPVGATAITSHITPEGWLTTGRLAFWNVTVSSATVPAPWFAPLLRQLVSDDQIQFLPADRESHHSADHHGINSTVTYRVPFTPRVSGRLQLPELRTHYFDPHTGRIETLTVIPPTPWTIALAWRYLAGGVSLLLALLAISVLMREMRRHWRYHTGFHAALRALANAQSPASARAALHQLARLEGWPDNISLTAWHSCWNTRYDASSILAHGLDQLNDASYGNRATVPLGEITAGIVSALRARRRRSKLSATPTATPYGLYASMRTTAPSPR